MMVTDTTGGLRIFFPHALSVNRIVHTVSPSHPLKPNVPYRVYQQIILGNLFSLKGRTFFHGSPSIYHINNASCTNQ